VAEHVIGGPPLPVRQDAVCLVELLEPLFGAIAAVDVGVMALGETTEGALDLRLVGVLRHTKNVVVVTLHGHRVADSTNWHSRMVSASPVEMGGEDGRSFRRVSNSCQIPS